MSIADLLETLPKRTVKMPDDYYDTRATAARDLAFTVTGVTRLDAIQRVLDSLNDNLKSGGSFRDWKKTIKDGGELSQLPAHRVELVFRNHSQTAYAHGRCRNIAENASTRPYLMYSSVGDSGTRPAHLKLDGVIRPVGDSFWQRNSVPNGHNCRCSIISLNEKQAKARGGITENPPDGFDAGWDYSPCTHRTQGDETSLQRKTETYHPKLRGFVDRLMQGFAAVMALYRIQEFSGKPNA